MSYHLFLLRHAKSDWENKTYDFDRPITDKGKRLAQRMGVYMAQQKLTPDIIISSPAKRTMLTSEKMLKAKGQGVEKISCDRRLYLADKKDIIKILSEIPDNINSVLIVAHNPGLEELLLSLADKKTSKKLKNNKKLFPTACLAHLKLAHPWRKIKTSKAQLAQIIYPKTLPKGFPFPSLTSKEMRVRPAYYYYQSSVIPYRIKKGKLEILIISSSKNNHYVIPKGIIEPGLTSQQSAAKEAFEEAGIKGIIDPKAIANYSMIKWKAKTNVEVFAMKVTEILDEKYWTEQHRGRQWLAVDEATKLIYQKDLKPIFLKFVKQLQAELKPDLKQSKKKK